MYVSGWELFARGYLGLLSKNIYLNGHQVEKGSKSMASVTRRMHIHSSKKMFECLVNVSPEKKTLKA